MTTLLPRKGNAIMQHECGITQRLLRRQKTMFRIAAMDGWSQTLIAQTTGLSPSSVGEYARGATAISGPAIMKLAEALPDELLSLLMPKGKQIVTLPEDIDHDKLADAFADYLHEKNAAHHPDSPAGRDISDCEADRLNGCVVQLPLKGKVA